MSEVPSELLSGLLAEAQDHIRAIRASLSRINGQPDPQAIQTIQNEVNILYGAAEMLELGPVVAVLSPFAATLDGITREDGWHFSEETHREILTYLENLETCFRDMGGPAPSSSNETGLPEIAYPEMPQELADIFKQEAQEHIQTIQSGMEALRKSPGDPEMLAELRRATHTLKGAAGAVGFEVISSTAHRMEDLLQHHLKAGTEVPKEGIDLLLDTTDLLEALLDPARGEEARALMANAAAKYPQLLGEDEEEAQAPAPGVITASPEAPTQPAPQSAGALRLPIENIDLLINRVGEIVINRAAFERHLGTMRNLLSDLDSSTRRLNRLASDIGTQIERTRGGYTGSKQRVDKLFDPIEMDQYTQLHQYARELQEATNDVADANHKLNFLTEDFDSVLVRERRLSNEVQNGLMMARLVSFSEIETRLYQAVRRTAQTVGKQVELNLTGFDTQVDKQVLEALVDPMMHLIRNAIDHGIETPEERMARGKNPTGLITITVARERGRVFISMTDDGGGIDIDRVQRRAASSGLIKTGDETSTEAVIDLLFMDGFSAAEAVTETSGRGVGLSIVKRAVAGLQGSIRVETRPGAGSTFILSVPVTLAITRALYVQSCGQTFAVPLEQVAGVAQINDALIAEYRDKGVIHYNEKAWSVYDLAQFVGGQNPPPRYGLLIEDAAQATLVFVHQLAGIHETVVKSLGTHLRRVHGIAGATISGTGQVILILDLPELLVAGQDRMPQPIPTLQPMLPASGGGLHVLVVDDSPSVRRVVSSFLERSGWRTTVAKDGIDALEKLAGTRPDVALVDIEMPRMNGYELLSEIRGNTALNTLPVVFLTSRAAAKHRQRAEQLGANGYLVKPYHEDQLLEELVRVTRNN